MNFKDLIVYQKAFSLSMQIFEISKKFPKEETYSLTDQIRRSSRSVSANIAEAYRKRAYPKHFYSKLTDCDAENSETQVWLQFAFECKYLTKKSFEELTCQSEEVGKLLNYMLLNPKKFGVKSTEH
ncbi:four helix bundle protein [Galbibacter sp. BG1]|uniref:four helix bundle protein n=1 Tax=Galbibacter sp. BG1 TaxID=1170699 RepID=UPI0015C108DD|nr:four helix bundle protein [Galbibacter sp. BG1]QLE00091.1 four helix bundle protein [Galbibacter sp. BG1]